MTKTHIIYIPFTGVGTNKILTDEWLKDRIEIFKNYTLKSLLNQTNPEFMVWLSFRQEEKDSQLVADLEVYLTQQRVRYICTFNGLIYFDDKNVEANKSLKYRLSLSLAELPQYESEKIYLTRIDSDDMFHKEVVQLIQHFKPAKALTLSLGLVYNKDTNEVAEWNPLTNPPFYTIIFPREVFFNAQKHIDWYEGFKSHEDIARLPHKVLWRGDNRTDRLYMVFTHNPKMHISTSWDHPFKGKSLSNQVLEDFGIKL